MSETKILYVAVPRGQDRVPVVSQKEWAQIFSEYPANLRYHAANLAAHNWDVAMINGRIVIASPWGGAHWIDKDGSREDLTEAEFDALYPLATDPDAQNGGEYTRSGGVLRHRKIVLPSPVESPCPACGGEGRIGPFFPGGLSAICGNCQSPPPAKRSGATPTT